MPEPISIPPLNLTKRRAPGPRPERLWWLAVLATFFALSNAIFLPAWFQLIAMSDSILPGGFNGYVFWCLGIGCPGMMIAQMLTLSFFAVLGPGSHLHRQGIVWLLAGILILSFAMGFALTKFINSGIGLPGSPVYSWLFAIPAVFCACQTPLWGLRYFARWRTAANDQDVNDLGQFSIRGMLAATAVVAVALGLCRLGLSMEIMPWGGNLPDRPRLTAVAWWSGIGIASASALAVSAVILPMTSMLVLRTQSAVLGVTAAAAYLAMCALASVVVMCIIQRNVNDAESAPLLFVFFLSITGFQLTPLAIFRSAGYRLWWGQPVANA